MIHILFVGLFVLAFALPVAAQTPSGGGQGVGPVQGSVPGARVREEMKDKRQDVRGEVSDTRQDVREEIKDKRQDVREEIKDTRQDVREEIRDMRQDVREEVRDKRQDVIQNIQQLPKAERAGALQVKREEMKQDFQEKRDQFRQTVTEKRQAVRSLVQMKRAELNDRLKNIKDERKQQITLTMHDSLNAVGERRVTLFSQALDKIGQVLQNVISRTDKAEANGKDVVMVRTAISEAQSAVVVARTAIEVQSGKSYSIEVTTETTLKTNAGVARESLHNDLVAVRDVIKAAHEAVRKAAQTLMQVPQVDQEVEVEVSAEASQ